MVRAGLMLTCARCRRSLLVPAIQIEEGTKRMPLGRRCAEILGYLLPPVKRVKARHPRRRDERQGALTLEASP